MSNNVIEVKTDELRGLYNILTNYPSISKEQVQNEMHKVFGGLVFAHSSYASSNANSGDCFRLAFKSEGLAVYAGKQFIDIWVDYICA